MSEKNLQDKIRKLESEKNKLRQELEEAKIKTPICRGCGERLDGPHHSLCGDPEFG